MYIFSKYPLQWTIRKKYSINILLFRTLKINISRKQCIVEVLKKKTFRNKDINVFWDANSSASFATFYAIYGDLSNSKSTVDLYARIPKSLSWFSSRGSGISWIDRVRRRRLSSRRCRRRAEIHKTFPDYPGVMGRRVVSFTRIIFQQNVSRRSISRARFHATEREREGEKERSSYVAFANVAMISSLWT